MDKNCEQSGTMILTPCKEKDWEVLTWCFYLEKEIKGECPKDCPHKK